MQGTVIAVCGDETHGVGKARRDAITLVAGLGVDGDAHAGETVQHRSRVRRDPSQPNLRQVHLIHAELFDELRERGFEVAPGDMGENVTTRGIDLLALPAGTLMSRTWLPTSTVGSRYCVRAAPASTRTAAQPAMTRMATVGDR